MQRSLKILFVPASVLAATLALGQETSDWPTYGGDEFGQRYSALTEIDRDNVASLRVAWTYRTGETGEGFARSDKLAFEATPILFGERLYLTTPTDIVIALEPASGKEIWRYDPRIDRKRRYSEATSRGVSAWRDPDLKVTGPCSRRIFAGTLDARLIAIDAEDGKPCAGFGRDGEVDLTAGLRIRDPDDYLVTSPPAIYRDLVIVGSAIGDNRAVDVERGTVRAFGARDGKLRWSWDPVPTTQSDPARTDWSSSSADRTGAANAWSIITVDPALGLAFVPTGSASPDFFGGERPGANRYANSLVALEAGTGRVRWSQQLVHHDLWDYDVAAQPVLVEMEREGKTISAVLQATKMGMLFVFDRETGTPVFRIRERPVPRSDVPGEQASPTQPFPVTPSPLVSHAPVTGKDAWGLTFWDRGRCRERIESLRSEGIYTPPSLKGTILYPSYVGGTNWSSLAFDIQRQWALVPLSHLPMVVTLLPSDQVRPLARSGDYPESEFAMQTGTPYGMRREALLSPFGLPCTAPPWGSLVAVDLKDGTVKWQVPLGSTEDLAPFFVPTRSMGTPNLGGPIVTAGGVVFIAAAMDNYLRAFDLETGKELWKGRLPAGGQATPMTFRAGPRHRQYVVIAAGGHGGLGTQQGDSVLAFALPEKPKPKNAAP